MSRIVVVGGHGRTGKLVIDRLLKNGDEVVATVRSASHMAELVKRGVETAVLDLEASPLEAWVHTFSGADAVVFAAGSGDNESSAIDRKGVQRTVRAAAKAKATRYVAISSLGASTPLPEAFKVPEMKEYFAAKKTANKLVRNSSLFWTIIEPGELTEGRATGKIAAATGGIDNKKISRADVAGVVLAALANDKTIGATIQVVGGSTEIAKAIAAAIK